MRFLYTILLLLAFPVLALLLRREFLDRMQPALVVQVSSALARPEFSGVRPELNYLDVSLHGQVSDPAQREQARATVDAIQGVRCREEDNHLQIRPAITGTLAGSRLTLSGWLHSSKELGEIIAWIQELRPGLEVGQSGVQLDASVLPESIAIAKGLPPSLAQLQKTLQADASLKVARQDGNFRITGDLPTQKLRQAIVLAVPLGTGAAPLDFSELRAGPYVSAAPFAHEQALSRLLSVFLTSPGAQCIEAKGNELLIRGFATPSMRDRWMSALDRFPEQITVIAGFQVFPSLYHFPSYKPESTVAQEKLSGLRQSLAKSMILFEQGATMATPSQAALLDDAAAAIREAGTGVRVVAGSVPLPDETADIARQRAESIVRELVTRGVAGSSLETDIFESVSTAESPVARVELLVK